MAIEFGLQNQLPEAEVVAPVVVATVVVGTVVWHADLRQDWQQGRFPERVVEEQQQEHHQAERGLRFAG